MPHSSIPPPPTHGTSRAFIAAAVAMMLMMGGLLYWKLHQAEPKPSEPPPVVSAPPPPVLEAPPPAPPVEPPDAGSKKATIKRGSGEGSVTGVCGPDCNGNITSTLGAALQAKAGASRRCYERALLQDSTLSGRLVVNVRVGSDGRVCSASIGQNSINDPGLANCVAGNFRSATLPAPQGGCVDTAVPMNFVPKTQ